MHSIDRRPRRPRTVALHGTQQLSCSDASARPRSPKRVVSAWAGRWQTALAALQRDRALRGLALAPGVRAGRGQLQLLLRAEAIALLLRELDVERPLPLGERARVQCDPHLAVMDRGRETARLAHR